jgi:Spy/CpxP family protein refolding chaperone
MSRTVLILTALAAAAFALPAAAQTQQLPMPSERVGQETPAKKKTPEEVAKDKATKEQKAAEVKAGGAPMASEMKGQEKQAVKKTPEQIAKEKADKAKRGTTPEEQAKQAKQLPGG